MNNFRNLLFFLITSIFISCKPNSESEKPNIILIMADDMGYEGLSSYGSLSYNTPSIDSLAKEGIRFTQCVSQPLCTPSRVKMMTGLYNYRNYNLFGHIGNDEYTFGNLAKEAGYITCIAGKWQLNGLAYKEIINDWNDSTRPHQFGFDEYSLWQLTKGKENGERYAHPYIEQNGKVLERNENDYGPDIFSDFVVDFIERNADSPFFVYYPMVLPHNPFVPTPDSKEWNKPEQRYKGDTTYFKDMVEYFDKVVGKIVRKVDQLNIKDNTIIIFTSDNGTNPQIFTKTIDGIVQGGKANTTDAGTHVPLIVRWPEKNKEGRVYNGLIEFSDFFPTIADIVDQEVSVDGESFYPLIAGEKHLPRKSVFVRYDPRWNENTNRFRGQFARTVDYKLYADGNFYNVANDKLEESPLDADSLKAQEKSIKRMLKKELSKHPEPQ